MERMDTEEPYSHVSPLLLPLCARGSVSEIQSWSSVSTSFMLMGNPVPINAEIQRSQLVLGSHPCGSEGTRYAEGSSS